MNKTPFFSLAEMKQPVNQWLCIAFLGVFCFWTVLYYFTERTQIIAESYTSETTSFMQNQNTEIRPSARRPSANVQPAIAP